MIGGPEGDSVGALHAGEMDNLSEKFIYFVCYFTFFLLLYQNCDIFFFLWVQDTLDELKLVTGGTLPQAGNLQDCFLQQIEPVSQYPGKACNQ